MVRNVFHDLGFCASAIIEAWTAVLASFTGDISSTATYRVDSSLSPSKCAQA